MDGSTAEGLLEQAGAKSVAVDEEFYRVKRNFNENLKIWFHQNRFNVLGAVSAVTQAVIIATVVIPGETFDDTPRQLEDISLTEFVVERPATSADPVPEGEIKETNDLNKPTNEPDPRISGAVNPAFAGASLPIDLTTHIKPEYTDAARQAGIEGRAYVQVVIADTGEVLQVRNKGKKLGFGLEASIRRAYRRKRFKPSRLQGKPITVKLVYPVRFKLN